MEKRDDLIYQVQMEVLQENLTQTVNLSYMAEVEVNTIKIYFSSVSGALLIAVSVCDNNKLVFQKHYPIHAYHQFVIMPYDSKASKQADHALKITGLSHQCRKLSVVVTFSILTTEVLDMTQVPDFMVETYGKISESNRNEADSYYQGTLKAV